jgi:transmembrane sensor
MADPTRIAQLIVKRLRGTISVAEEIELDTWINSSPENQYFMETEIRPEVIAGDLLVLADLDEDPLDDVWESIEQALAIESTPAPATIRHPHRRPGKTLLIGMLGVAAATLLFFFVKSTFWPAEPNFSSSRNAIWKSQSAVVTKPVQGPMLTISKDIVLGLDTIREGAMAWLGNWLILKMSNQHIAYVRSNKTREVSPMPDSIYNSISLPTGGSKTWQITLPDGSGVFLDPGSSLSFAVHPSGKKTPQRMVALNGSAFFQVAHDPQSPFILETNKDEITVYGTSFFIKDHLEEPNSVITQYSGRLQVTNGKGSAFLESGQQSTIDPALANIPVEKNVTLPIRPIVPLEAFDFSRQDLTSALHEVAQYYRIANVHVAPDLDTLTPGKLRMGKIPKDLPLNELLHALEEDNMHFTATEEAITVTR